MATTMTVQRAGYFDGTYAQAGDVIAVPDEYVDALKHSGFAVEQPPPDPPPAPTPPPPPPNRKR